MLGRTHDLAAFTTLTVLVSSTPIPQMSFATLITSLGANFIGGLAPDIDQPTADLWRRIPAGSLFGRLIAPMFGKHRMISHSFLGIALFGIGSRYLLSSISSVLLVNMDIVWASFMIGFISHLVMDTFTKEGVPWLFPIPIHFGIPPLKSLRITTGGLIEKLIVFPGLLLINAYLIYLHYSIFFQFIKSTLP